MTKKKHLKRVCHVKQPMWDITIHPLQGPAGTHSFLQSMWDITIHPFRAPAGTHYFLQSMWDSHQPTSQFIPFEVSLTLVHFSNRCGTPTISTPLGPASLLAHRLVSTPLRRTARRLTHRLVSHSNTICNDPSPPLADIVLFLLSLTGFPSRL